MDKQKIALREYISLILGHELKNTAMGIYITRKYWNQIEQILKNKKTDSEKIRALKELERKLSKEEKEYVKNAQKILDTFAKVSKRISQKASKGDEKAKKLFLYDLVKLMEEVRKRGYIEKIPDWYANEM